MYIYDFGYLAVEEYYTLDFSSLWAGFISIIISTLLSLGGRGGEYIFTLKNKVV